ncbi:MAG: hypothetical protein ACJA2S_000793 [Cyclobacteriaceae bacterium]
MNDETIVAQSKKLKSEGIDYGEIRSRLKDSDFQDDEITSAFKLMDEQEVEELLISQKLKTARAKLIISIVLTIAIVVYNIYRFGLEDEIDFLILLLPLSIFGASYYSFRSIKSKNKSAE